MLKLLNAGKYDDAAQQLLEWDHAGGVEVEGLKRRRETELQLWMGGVTSSSGDGLSSSPERADA